MTQNRLRQFLLATVVTALCALTASPAMAFDNEPDGWGGAGWGVTAESFVKADKGLRKTLKLKDIRKTIETQDVVVRTANTLEGSDVDAQWVFGKDGLHTVMLRWQNRRPEAYDAWKEMLAKLEARWGKARHITDSEYVWEGKTSKIVAKKALAPTGSAVEVRLTRVGTAGSGEIGDAPEDEVAPAKENKRGRDLLGDTDSDFP